MSQNMNVSHEEERDDTLGDASDATNDLPTETFTRKRGGFS